MKTRFTCMLAIGLVVTAYADSEHAVDVWVTGSNTSYSLGDGGRPAGLDEVKKRIMQRAATSPQQAVYIITDEQSSRASISGVCWMVRDGGLTNVIISVFESSANPAPRSLVIDIPGMAISVHHTPVPSLPASVPEQPRAAQGESVPAVPSAGGAEGSRSEPDGSAQKLPTDIVPLVALPPYAADLEGENEVRFRNPNNFPVLVAIRSGDRGTDLKVAARAVGSARLPAGRHVIYMMFATEPGALYRGDYVDLPSAVALEVNLPSFTSGTSGAR